MGLLVEGTPLKWEDAKKHADHVRKHGIEQFLALWRKYEGKQGAVLRWGDEVEYFVAKLCPIDKWARLPLRAPEILAKLREFRDALPDCNCAKAITWHPEYGLRPAQNPKTGQTQLTATNHDPGAAILHALPWSGPASRWPLDSRGFVPGSWNHANLRECLLPQPTGCSRQLLDSLTRNDWRIFSRLKRTCSFAASASKSSCCKAPTSRRSREM